MSKKVIAFKCKICLDNGIPYDYAPEVSNSFCKICKQPICFSHLTWQSKINYLFFRFKHLICKKCYKCNKYSDNK